MKVKCVFVGKLEEAIRKFNLWDEKTFIGTDCVEWKSESPYWCYTYPRTTEENMIVSAFLTEKRLTENEIRLLTPFANFYRSIFKKLNSGGIRSEIQNKS